MKQDKEIIGYKLIKQEYEKAAIAIVDSLVGLWNDRINFLPNDTWYNKFKNAGVLDIWFTPVYKEEPKFEVGKWYKITAYKGKVVYYIKYKNTDKDNMVLASNYICVNSHTSKLIEADGGFTYANIIKLEGVLEEIQQYLPDGHPDKIVKDWTKATKEELLAEAKRRYPEGALVRSALIDHSNYLKHVVVDEIRVYNDRRDVCTNVVTLYSKSENKWAEIVESTKEETKELVWIDSNNKTCKISEIPDKHLDNIIKCLNGQGIKTIPNPYNGKTTSEWRTIMTDELRRRLSSSSTNLFSKEQLEAINKMIDDKVKELQ